MTQKVALVRALLLGLVGCEPAAEAFLPQFETVDVLIEDGVVFDGLGSGGVRADVVIVGDRIVFVGDAAFSAFDLERRVRQRIDAGGRAVTPGFIDLHSHGDPLETSAFENFLAMGVTTITLGQDGSSPDTANLSQWLYEVSAAGIGPNLAMFVGHGTLRSLSGIGRDRRPAEADMSRMLALLDDTLDYTFGLSTGLEYNPGLNAGGAELRAMAEIVGRHDRVIMSHLRSEDDGRLESSIAELLEQGEHARVHISHLKSVYGKGSSRADEVLTILSRARRAGIDITADVYPYTASYTGIGLLFPVWAKTADQFETARLERRAELEDYLRQRVEQRNGPEATLLGTPPWTGKTLAELAFELESPFEEVLIDAIGPQGASAACFVMDDALQSRLLSDSDIGISSDGSPTGFHPRGHGSFAKIIETYVVEEGVLSLEEAVRKMTSFPAGILGIEDRGVLKAGMKADVLVFDPAKVRATATYESPLELAEGFDVVIVNGRIARREERLSGALPGQVLRPEPPSPVQP
jgi:N-acyl-D-aspartate/D-glutamate deacylase